MSKHTKLYSIVLVFFKTSGRFFSSVFICVTGVLSVADMYAQDFRLSLF